MQQNNFGHAIPSPNDCLRSNDLTNLLRGQMHRILHRRADLDQQTATDIAQEIFFILHPRSEPWDTTGAVRALLNEHGLLQSLRGDLPDRARRMAIQVTSFLKGRSVLDFGCGNGEVGVALHRDGNDVLLYDIVDSRSPAAQKLPFAAAGPGSAPGTLLLLNVLHHAADPLAALDDAVAWRAGRIVLIESVYDVSPHDIPAAERQRLIGENPSAAVWLAFAAEEQFAYNAFWDWFFAQVVNDLPQTPFNYQRADEWREHFDLAGYRQSQCRWLGIDQPLVPEFHVLMVFDRP